MKAKATSVIVLACFLVSIFAGAPTFGATMVSAENEAVVGAWHGRYCYYDAGIFEDSISGMLIGDRMRRFDIRPEGYVEIENASIVLETPFGEENYPFRGINSAPYVEPTIIGPEDGNYTYKWDFGNTSEQAAVWIHTNFSAPFDPGFSCQRIWNPWITSRSVNQTITIEFTPSTIEFINVHITVGAESTEEASVTIVPESNSSSPSLIHERFWLENGDWANWAGNPELGITYMFSVNLTVVNECFPEPVFYKPSVGIGANFDYSESFPPTSTVTIEDDIDGNGVEESSVTYNGTGDFVWQEVILSENSVSFPRVSTRFSEVYTKAEGRAFVKLEDEFIRESAVLRINKEPNTVRLSVNNDEHIFWWKITEYRSRGSVIGLKCEPAPPGTGGGEPGPVPITVTIPRFEEGRRVIASGPRVCFTGHITGIEWPPS